MALNQQLLGENLDNMTYFQEKLLQVGNVGICLFIIACLGLVISILFLYKKQAKITVSLAKFTHSSYGQLLLTSMGILWASLISVFGGKLQEQWFDGKTWGAENLFFGVSVILAIILSILHYIYGQIKEQQNQSRPSFEAVNENSTQGVNAMGIINNCILDLQNIVRLEKNKPGVILGDAQTSNNYNLTLDNAIETCMKSILLVTKRVNEGNDDVNVKANIFNLIPAWAAHSSFSCKRNHQQENNAIFTKESIDNSPFFLFSTNLHSRLEHCESILACDQSYTCEIDRKNNFKKCKHPSKNDVPPICMPVSHSMNLPGEKLPHPNLFGAPEAITSNREVYIGNLSEHIDSFFNDLRKSPQYREHITGYYEQSIRTYYEKDKDKPKSILSIPLGKLDLDINNLNIPVEFTQCACVINIYINKVNYLENELKSEAFYSMLKPLCHSLSVLISLKIAYTNVLKDYTIKNPVETMTKEQEVING